VANRSERRRTIRPRTSKPLIGILGDVDERIVPAAPPPAFNTILTTRLQVSLPAEACAAIKTV
jgi:hypothetical protein